MKFRIFVRDVGSRNYSGFKDVDAPSTEEALKGLARFSGNKKPYYIALPHDRRDLWPNSQTGLVPKEALTCQ